MSAPDHEDPQQRVVIGEVPLDGQVVGTRFLARSGRANVGEMEVHVDGEREVRIAHVTVSEDWRNQGIASCLFLRSRERYPEVASVTATAETPEGRVFLASLQRRHPDLNFRVLEEVSSYGTPEPREDDW